MSFAKGRSATGVLTGAVATTSDVMVYTAIILA